MKDILKVMRFDLLCAKPLAMGAYIVVAVFSFLLGMLCAPALCGYTAFGAIMFIAPLPNIAEKSGFNKLYGILPVQRKGITRARFMYIFFVLLATELMTMAMEAAALSVKLYRILPNQNSEMMQLVRNAFSDGSLSVLITAVIFAAICLIMGFIEMMGQIFGRENEFKIIGITLSIITVCAILFFQLSKHGVIPMIQLPSLPETVFGRAVLCVAINAAMLFICVLFGEITAAKVIKREL